MNMLKQGAGKKGFTLIELMAVIAIIGILAALLFPVFAKARAQAKQTQCISNLRQIGAAMAMYMTDHDEQFPQALDASDKFRPDIWSDFPEFQARIPEMPLMPEALQAYIKSKDIWRCPSDNGTDVLDNHIFTTEDFRTSRMWDTYGSSYFFRTEIAFKFFSSTAFQLPSNVNVMFDGAGHWHGSDSKIIRNEWQTNPNRVFDKLKKYRYNCLFGDFHAKSLSYDQMQTAWNTPL